MPCRSFSAAKVGRIKIFAAAAETPSANTERRLTLFPPPFTGEGRGVENLRRIFPLTPSRSLTLASLPRIELGLARVRHKKVDRSRINPTSDGRGEERSLHCFTPTFSARALSYHQIVGK